MIPKIIHYVWLGEKPLPEKNAKYLEGWKEKCPDYEIMLWNEKNFDISKSNNYVKQAYEKKKFAFVSDYIRLHALKCYGGIYLDTDVEILKNFDEFLDRKMFVCRENSAYISTAVIGAEKDNSLISELLNTYENRNFILDDGILDMTTNVEKISIFLHQKFKYPLNNKSYLCDEISIFKGTYFSPKDYFSGRMKNTKNAYAIHHFDGSWDANGKSYVKKVARIILKILPKFIAFALINIFKNKQLKSKEKLMIKSR